MSEVVNNPDAHRYEIHLDGTLAGFADYRVTADRIVFTHTEVDPGFGGRGVGSTLVHGALEDVRQQGRKAESWCSFVDHYAGKHPEYAELFRN